MKLADVFAEEELNAEERNKISFADNSYDEYAAQVEDILLERYYMIAKAKSIYDWAILQEILQECNSLSEAKVNIYEKHKEDLQVLKKIARDLGREIYQKIFGSPEKNVDNYSAYIGMYKVNGRKKNWNENAVIKKSFINF